MMMGCRAYKFPAALLLLLASLIAGILLSETVLRLFFPQGLRKIIIPKPFYGKYHPEFGWANREHARGDAGNIHISINGNGLRDIEHSYSKPQAKKRVFIIGDSITFGYGLNLDDTYPFLLQKMLGEKYEVINGGVLGYGLDQEYLFFSQEGRKYSPDVLVVGFSAGDIYDNQCSMRFGTHKPYFRVQNGRLTLCNVPVPPKSTIKELFLRDTPFQAFLLDNSHLCRLLFYFFKDIRDAKNVSIEAMDNNERLVTTSALVSALKQECDNIGCRLLFIVVPQEDWIKRYRQEGNEMFKRAHNSALDILKEAEIEYIDLWDPFVRDINAKLFQVGDPVHTTREGNETIAKEIREKILAAH